jgi:hypothetical protein
MAVGRYQTVELLNPATRALVRKLDGHKGAVNAIAFSPDGSLLFAAGGENGLEGEIKVWRVADGSAVRTIEGHRDTERGQEFELHTEYVVGGEPRWDETCTFLARRRSAPGAGSTTTVVRTPESSPDSQAIKSSSFRAPAGLGRRYGFISGDVNPIHMSDLTARAFGFPRAIAHGMWSLGRLVSDFEASQFDGGCELSVNFKLPIYMPSWLMLQRW